MEILEYLEKNRLLLDADKQTSMNASQIYEDYDGISVKYPFLVKQIHLRSIQAGSNLLTTNTVLTNPVTYSDSFYKEIIKHAIESALLAKSQATQFAYVAYSLGYLPKEIETYDQALSIYKDIVNETSNYCDDLDAYLYIANDNLTQIKAALDTLTKSDKPIFVTMIQCENEKSTIDERIDTILGYDIKGIGFSNYDYATTIELIKSLKEKTSLHLLVRPILDFDYVDRKKGTPDSTKMNLTMDFYEEMMISGVDILGGGKAYDQTVIKVLNKIMPLYRK